MCCNMLVLAIRVGRPEDHKKVQCKGEEGKVVHGIYREMQVIKGVPGSNLILTLYT